MARARCGCLPPESVSSPSWGSNRRTATLAVRSAASASTGANAATTSPAAWAPPSCAGSTTWVGRAPRRGRGSCASPPRESAPSARPWKAEEPMPSRDTLERFVARVEENAHVEAILEFYTEGATMRENFKPPRGPRAELAERERKTMERASSVRSTCVRPVLVNGDIVVVRWIFQFEWKDGRAGTRMEELAYQRWEGERIAEEQ